jgi:lysyl-tRNA synthetase class 2
MKRLLAAGCDKIFQICHCFRAKERGRKHLEEFTMLEWYRMDGDYLDLMEDCRSLLRSVLGTLSRQPALRHIIAGSWFGNADIDRAWQKITVAEAFHVWANISVREALDSGRFDEIVSVDIEPCLGLEVPAFLYDYPAECASLALLKDGGEGVAERFELYINGFELANGFSELTDSAEQRRRFTEELKLIERQRSVALHMPDTFLADLDRIDRAAGIALGLDRLLMLLLSAETIDDVVSFSPRDWG